MCQMSLSRRFVKLRGPAEEEDMKHTPAALGWLSSNAQDWLCFAARFHNASATVEVSSVLRWRRRSFARHNAGKSLLVFGRTREMRRGTAPAQNGTPVESPFRDQRGFFGAANRAGR